ncbi:hypothetical protein [Acidiferrobacter sp.]|jgi:hypothetical protein|uniref:hypothetical protein n=2 Tax=Acidiferrobacter sp. TaxID=1872107 RepID=UPI00261AFCE0|nr:hypothetical protein [Acidiferrobacter sp.]
MSYPEGLRNYQGPWPPPKDFLLSPEDARVLTPTWSSWGRRVFAVMMAASVVGLILPDTDFRRIPVVGTLIHGLGLVFPMIRAVALYSKDSLADVAGVSVLIIGMVFVAIPAMWTYCRKAFAVEGYSLLMRYIHVGYAPSSRSVYLGHWIAVCFIGLALALINVVGDIQGYMALYVYHTSLRVVATNSSDAFGLLSANGLNAQHGVASSFYFFGTLGHRFQFPLFALMYGASLAGYALFVIVEMIVWTHASAVLKATREDWRVLKILHLNGRTTRKEN